MPTLALPISATAIRSIDFKPYKRCSKGVCYLPSQHSVACENIVKLNDVVKIDEQIGEPYGCTQVVEDMSDAVRELLDAAQLLMLVVAWCCHL